MEEEGSEKDGDDGVDVGVGGDFGDGDVLEEVDVGGVADEGAEGDEVEDGRGCLEIPVDVVPVAEQEHD